MRDEKRPTLPARRDIGAGQAFVRAEIAYFLGYV